MKEFRFSRLVIALVVLMKYMTKISDAGSIGVQGVQTRLKRNVRFESK